MGFLTTLGYGDAAGQGDSILSNLVRMRHLDQQERASQIQEAYRNAMMRGAIAKQQREQAVGQILSRIPTETVETQMPVYDSPMAIEEEPTQTRTPVPAHEWNAQAAKQLMPIDANVALHFQARADAEREKQVASLRDMWKYKYTAAQNSGDQNAIKALEQSASVNPFLKDIVADVPINLAEAKAEKPTVHSFLEGGMHVEKQWNPKTEKWDVLSTAPRYKPEGDSSGKEEIKAAKERRKEYINTVKRYNAEVQSLKGRADAATRSGVPMTDADWNTSLQDIYTRYAPQFATVTDAQWKDNPSKASSTSTITKGANIPALPKGWKWETEGKVAIDDKGKRKQWVE